MFVPRRLWPHGCGAHETSIAFAVRSHEISKIGCRILAFRTTSFRLVSLKSQPKPPRKATFRQHDRRNAFETRRARRFLKRLAVLSAQTTAPCHVAPGVRISVSLACACRKHGLAAHLCQNGLGNDCRDHLFAADRSRNGAICETIRHALPIGAKRKLNTRVVQRQTGRRRNQPMRNAPSAKVNRQALGPQKGLAGRNRRSDHPKGPQGTVVRKGRNAAVKVKSGEDHAKFIDVTAGGRTPFSNGGAGASACRCRCGTWRERYYRRKRPI